MDIMMILAIAGHGPLELRGLGGVYYIKFIRYYNGIRRLGRGGWEGFITLIPCVPRYDTGIARVRKGGGS